MGIQHQFGRKHVGEVRYVGTHGVGLFQNINSNFFTGPLVNGFTRNITVPDGPDADTNPDTLAFNFPSFSSQLPPGTTAQVCADLAATRSSVRVPAMVASSARPASLLVPTQRSRFITACRHATTDVG